jgi:hypothetical protein
MRRPVTVVLYVVLLAASVVVVDVLFFRHRFWERLLVHIGIVVVFAVVFAAFSGVRRGVRRVLLGNPEASLKP